MTALPRMTAPSGEQLDLRLVALAAPAWTGAWAGTAGAPTVGAPWLGLPAVIAAGVAVAAAVIAMSRRWRTVIAAAVVLLTGSVLGSLHSALLTAGPVADLAQQEAVVHTSLVITTDPQLRSTSGVRGDYVTVRAQLTELSGRGRTWRLRSPVLIVARGDLAAWGAVVVGSRVEVIARLERADPGDDIAALVSVRGPPRTTAGPGLALNLAERVRQGLRDSVSTRPAEPRALVPALVVGDTAGVDSQLQQDFRATGLTHLTAVSGANLTLLLAFVLPLARWCGVRGWWLRVVGLLGVLIFVALCRAEPSVLRAAAMGLVALAALGTGARRHGIRNLCVAVIVLTFLDPFLSRSLGFVLSVLASAGIVWWSRRWTDALARWLPTWIAAAVAVPLAATVATAAVVAGISGQVSMAGLLANALAGPAVGPATVLGFLAAGLSLVSPALGSLAGWAASWCAQWIIWVAHAGAALPGSSWRWPSDPPALTLLGAAALVLAFGLPVALARWWLSLPLALIMVAALLTGPLQPGWPPRDWVLVGCDVGQGDGLVVNTGPGEAVLVDAGPDPVAIDRCLRQLGVRRLPVIVLTHFHADHVDGLQGAVSGRQVGRILVSPLSSPVGEAKRVRDRAAGLGIPVHPAQPGEQGHEGAASWTVLGPLMPATDPGLVPGDSAESATQNDASIVLALTVRGIRVLLTGDVEPDGQARLLAAQVDLRADVLKVPHHGSARQDPAFLAATRARVAIASAGLHNDYGHPAPRTLARLQSLGMTVLRTDQQGSVALVEGPDGLSAVAQR